MTPYVAMKFDVSLEILLDTFSISTHVGEFVLAKWVYKNCSISVFKKITSIHLVELNMVNFDFIHRINCLHTCYASVECRTKVVKFQFSNEPIIE